MPVERIFPPATVLVELAPEEIAGFLLEYLRELPEPALHRGNLLRGDGSLQRYAGAIYEPVVRVMSEAWEWLLREGMIAPRPDGTDWIFITRRGRAIGNHQGVEAYRRAAVLRAEALDPRIADKVAAEFRRGEYDTAVFAAFKQLEVRVRQAGGYGDGEIGVTLMRKAFNPENGPLTDMAREAGERVGLMEAFAGAIGVFKNPGSHRNVQLEAEEAAALIYYANYLLRVVELRAGRG